MGSRIEQTDRMVPYANLVDPETAAGFTRKELPEFFVAPLKGLVEKLMTYKDLEELGVMLPKAGTERFPEMEVDGEHVYRGDLTDEIARTLFGEDDITGKSYGYVYKTGPFEEQVLDKIWATVKRNGLSYTAYWHKSRRLNEVRVNGLSLECQHECRGDWAYREVSVFNGVFDTYKIDRPTGEFRVHDDVLYPVREILAWSRTNLPTFTGKKQENREESYEYLINNDGEEVKVDWVKFDLDHIIELDEEIMEVEPYSRFPMTVVRLSV